MADDLLPLGGATASDVRDLKQSGLILPVRRHDETILLTNWDGEMHAVMLTGDHAFIFFAVSLKNPHTGLFIPEPQILVDMTSATDGVGHEHDVGVLILSQDQLAVVGSRAGDQFGDPQLIPLWTEVRGGSASAKVAFTRWAIGVPDGTEYRTLWEKPGPTDRIHPGIV